MTKRHVSIPRGAEAGIRGFIEEVDDRLSSGEANERVVRDVLIELFDDRQAYESWQNDDPVSVTERVRLQSHDPLNVALESEYYAEKDEAAFERSKPLQWLWRQFDASPLANNVAFALRFRQMLADHLFEYAGDNLRLFKGITMTYGHNISVGDNTVIHDAVHLDDRGRLDIGNRVSLSDGVHIYSHDHDLVDQTTVINYETIIEDDVRITYDSMVRAGCEIGTNALIGAKSVVQSDIPAHHVAVGSPAQSIRIKPGWEEAAVPIDETGTSDREARRLHTPIDPDVDEFDEFDRSLPDHHPG